jgi:hypothetical protein
MTLYSSGRRAALTTDRYPWVCTAPDFERYASPDDYEGRHSVIFDPRPEYPVRRLTNPENRILAQYREDAEKGIPYTDPDSWLANLGAMDAESVEWAAQWSINELDHAERVLHRLAALHAAAGPRPDLGTDQKENTP